MNSRLYKLLRMPFSNATKDVTVFQAWKVRWSSRKGAFSTDTRPELEAFTNKADAIEFADALRAAFKLVRNTSENRVTITED